MVYVYVHLENNPPDYHLTTFFILKGERGPEIVKQLMGPFYQAFAQSAKILDDLSFGAFGKLGKKAIFWAGALL